MNSQILHPENELLEQFARGELELQQIDEIQRHLADCPPCCQAVDEIPDDHLLNVVRRAGTRPDVDATVVHVSPTAESAPNEADRTQAAGRTPATTSIADLPRELAEHPRYRVLELIGRGGMGDVYKAEHRLMERVVALKIIKRDFTRNSQAVERFQREVRAAASLAHGNIVAAYDAEQAGNTHFLALEYVEGTDLANIVRTGGPLSVGAACNYISQAACGLQHAHDQGLVHRDIKPHNLMVTSSETVKILDFGLASLTEGPIDHEGADNQRTDLTTVGAIMGTPDYISPEQATDAHSADNRSDIYSLGATFYFLLAGKPPFAEGSVVEKLQNHADSEAERIDAVRVDVPAEVADVIVRMMSKNPDERFQSPAEVADALAPFVEQHRTSPEPRTRPASSLGPFGPFWIRATLAVLALTVVVMGVVLYLATDKGTLVIDSQDENVEVVIRQNGHEVSIVDTVTGSKFIVLPSGEYEVSLKGDQNEFVLDARDFRLKRGSKTIVSVRRAMQPAVIELAAEDHPRIDDAIKATSLWLRLVHSQQYEQAYDTLAAAKLQELVAKRDFVAMTKAIRGPLGAMGLHRKPKTQFKTSLNGFGPGEYMTFEWNVEFSVGGLMQELLTLKMQDGKWRVLGYQLRKQKPGDDDATDRQQLQQVQNSIGTQLVLIPPGEFQMGSANDEPGRNSAWERPHGVKITKPFYMATHEVTQEEYKRVTGRNPFEYSPTGLGKDKVQGLDTGRFPAENVSWEDAVKFCRLLSERPAERAAGRSYRLPTEAEWEYACRAGTGTSNHFGKQWTLELGNVLIGDDKAADNKSLRRPTTVKSYQPNAFGLYDMHGNVSEWVADWFEMDYFADSPVSDPQGPASSTIMRNGGARTIKGGSCSDPLGRLRSAYRDYRPADIKYGGLGFRVVCTVK